MVFLSDTKISSCLGMNLDFKPAMIVLINCLKHFVNI